MISLDENNRRAFAIHTQDNSPRKNGIACPDCGEELMDTNPLLILCSEPPKKDVKCSVCEYTGYRNC